MACSIFLHQLSPPLVSVSDITELRGDLFIGQQSYCTMLVINTDGKWESSQPKIRYTLQQVENPNPDSRTEFHKTSIFFSYSEVVFFSDGWAEGSFIYHPWTRTYGRRAEDYSVLCWVDMIFSAHQDSPTACLLGRSALCIVPLYPAAEDECLPSGKGILTLNYELREEEEEVF